jgi:hypothetical protein
LHAHACSAEAKQPVVKMLKRLRLENAWWARQDSNLGPMDYESTALTTELRARFSIKLTQV